MAPIIAIGCPCPPEGPCPTEPVWLIVVMSGFMIALVAGLWAMLTDRSWSFSASAVTAAMGIPLGAWESGHAFAMGVFEMSAFATLAAVSVVLAVVSRSRVRASETALAAGKRALELTWDGPVAPEAPAVTLDETIDADR